VGRSVGMAKKSGLRPSSVTSVLSGLAIPFFDLSQYELDEKTPWQMEDGAIVWNLTRVVNPCPDQCPFKSNCPTVSKIKCGSTDRADFPHLPVGNTPQILRITVQRPMLTAEPKDVEIPVSRPHPGIEANHRMSTGALEFAIEELEEGEKIAKIAERLRRSERFIASIKSEFIPELPWPITLCINPKMTCFRIDEVYIGKKRRKKVYTLLLDATHNSFIGLVPGNASEAIGPALVAIRARCKIESATMDFGGYVPIVRSYFPGITITGDKFHLMQRLQGIMDYARKSATHALQAEDLESIRIWLNACAAEMDDKDGQKAILNQATTSKVATKLEEDLYDFKTYFKNLPHSKRKKIRGWLRQIPSLRVPYFFLQLMYRLLNKKKIPVEKAKGEFWEIVAFLRAKAPDAYEAAEFFFRTRQEEIEAYFETGDDNSRAEGFIRQLREMLIVSRGLRYQELVRRLIRKYGKGSPMCQPGEPGGDEKREPMKACTSENQPNESRHGKHARKKYPVEDLDPEPELSFDPQGDLSFE